MESFPFILLMQWITLIGFHMLNHPWIPGINLSWSWYIILVISYWIQFVSFLKIGIYLYIGYSSLSLSIYIYIHTQIHTHMGFEFSVERLSQGDLKSVTRGIWTKMLDKRVEQKEPQLIPSYGTPKSQLLTKQVWVKKTGITRKDPLQPEI